MRLRFPPFASLCLLFGILGYASLHAETTSPRPEAVAHRIARAAGFAQFHRVEHITFTFHARIGDTRIEREWRWWPFKERVTLESAEGGRPFTYARAAVTPQSPERLRAIDRKFVNDSYWLFFPFHVVWDPTVRMESLPDSEFTGDTEASGALRIRYPDDVGYTPGDVYEVYYDDNYRITRWVYRKRGSGTPTRITRWETYEQVGPLTLSLRRPSPEDSDFLVRFSDVSVKWRPPER